MQFVDDYIKSWFRGINLRDNWRSIVIPNAVIAVIVPLPLSISLDSVFATILIFAWQAMLSIKFIGYFRPGSKQREGSLYSTVYFFALMLLAAVASSLFLWSINLIAIWFAVVFLGMMAALLVALNIWVLMFPTEE